MSHNETCLNCMYMVASLLFWSCSAQVISCFCP